MSNEQVLVDQFVKEAQSLREHPLPDDVAFEYFAANTTLRALNLSDEELSAGMVGGGQDGGIDAFYTFLDEALLDEDASVLSSEFRPSDVRRGADLSLWILQAKRTPSFAEDAFDRVRASTEKLLDLTLTQSELEAIYSASILARAGIFTQAWKALSVRAPKITIKFLYVTRGSTSNVSGGVRAKMDDLKGHFRQMVPGASVDVELVGARELWEIASAVVESDLQLKFVDYISQGDSYSGIVSLPEYYRFLSSDAGDLRTGLFDWNVRDYQGGVAVNRQIEETLRASDRHDFWWLNNGITILCSSVNIGGDKTFTLAGVQIVNGMQTSHAIHEVLRDTGADSVRHRDRSVHVRVIKTQDDATRDKIIRATNSQTKVPDASLHATEDLHRQIESHFLAHGWYYDRRKNFYKNAGKPSDRIVSIAGLGQAIMAVGLSRPDDARARPTSLLNREDDYAAIFNPDLPLGIYLWIAQLQRQVDSLLANDDRCSEPSVRTNARFYVSNFIASRMLKARIYAPGQLSRVSETAPALRAEAVSEALDAVLAELESLARENGWQPERASKSHQLTQRVIARALETGPEGMG